MKTQSCKTICAILAASLTMSIVAGCSASNQAGDSAGDSGAAVQVDSAGNVISEMNFDAALTLKKPSPAAGQEPNILFLGNDYTLTGDLPGTFDNLSQEGGYTPNVISYTDYGYALSDFVDSDNGLGLIALDDMEQNPWDFVVLQEDTRVATIVDSRDKQMYPAVKTLDSYVKGAGAQMVLMETWAFKDGDDLNEEFEIDKKTTRAQMQTEIYNSNNVLAQELGAILTPVGHAFMRSSELYPNVGMWDDGMLASSEGTYLAACVLYATIYDKSPVGNEYYDIIDEDIAKALQQVAADVVLGTSEAEANTELTNGLGADADVEEEPDEDAEPGDTDATADADADSADVTLDGLDDDTAIVETADAASGEAMQDGEEVIMENMPQIVPDSEFGAPDSTVAPTQA